MSWSVDVDAILAQQLKKGSDENHTLAAVVAVVRPGDVLKMSDYKTVTGQFILALVAALRGQYYEITTIAFMAQLPEDLKEGGKRRKNKKSRRAQART